MDKKGHVGQRRPQTSKDLTQLIPVDMCVGAMLQLLHQKDFLESDFLWGPNIENKLIKGTTSGGFTRDCCANLHWWIKGKVCYTTHPIKRELI